MKNITSRRDLLERKLELQMQLEQHRAQIHEDIQEVKKSLGPMLNIASFVSKATTRDPRGNVLVKTGANLAIDWATRKLVPGRNSLIGSIGGFFVKNLASHLFKGSKNQIAS